MPFFSRDGLMFHYRDEGDGVPIILQHGLGADVNQPFGLIRPPFGIRLLAVDFRAHGETRPLGDPEKIGLASFADDVVAFMDELHLPRAVVGGISMGAAVALNVALRYPERVLGLIISRPAWLDGPNPRTVEIYACIARLIREHGVIRGKAMFRQSIFYREVVELSPDAARSLLRQFEHPRAQETVVKLERIPPDRPYDGLHDLRSLGLPTLVLGNRQDPIHPYTYAGALAGSLPRTTFRELTPKSVSEERHRADAQIAFEQFVRCHLPVWRHQSAVPEGI